MTNNNFEIFDLSFHDCRFLIINKDFVSLGAKLCYISKELAKEKYVGEVIFNTLTSTCNKNKQYSKAYFNGSEIEINSLKPLTKIDRKIRLLVSNYFRKNKCLLDNLPFSIV